MKKTILTIFLMVIISCKEEEEDKKKLATIKPIKTIQLALFVFPPTGLNLRENPSIESKTLKTLQFNESVDFISDSEMDEEINSIKGRWFNVRYKELTGFIFSTFLSKKPLEKIYNKSKTYYMLSIDQPNCEIDVEIYCAFTVIYDNSNKLINRFENMAKPAWHDDLNIAYNTGAGDGGGYFGAKTLINVLNKNSNNLYLISGDFDHDEEGYRDQTVEINGKVLIFRLSEKDNLLQIFQGEFAERQYTAGKLLFKKEGSKLNKVNLERFDEILTFDIEKNLANKEKFEFNFFKEKFYIPY